MVEIDIDNIQKGFSFSGNVFDNKSNHLCDFINIGRHNFGVFVQTKAYLASAKGVHLC